MTRLTLAPFLFLNKSEPGTGFFFFFLRVWGGGEEMEALSSNEWKLLLMP